MTIDNNSFPETLDRIMKNDPGLTVLEIDTTNTDKTWIGKLVDALLGRNSEIKNTQITSIIFVRPIIPQQQVISLEEG